MHIASFGERIEHVVILMMENRSYDHVLGSLTRDEDRADLAGLEPDVEYTNAGPDGHLHEVHPLAGHVEHGDRAFVFPTDPAHDWRRVEVQMRNGMSGFVKAHADKHPGDPHPASILGFLGRAEQPMTYFLADNFVVCDHWFSAVPGNTMPNRFYALAGHSAGFRENPGIGDLFVQLPTIFDHLGGDWNLYADNPTTLHMLKGLISALKVQARKKSIKQFEQHAAAGTLPAVSWIAPQFAWADGFWPDLVWSGNANDDHPPADVRSGQNFIRRIYNAVSQPKTWPKTLLIIVYDEHGGFYDHVTPPDLAESERMDDFKKRGPRVPAILVSPFTQTIGPERAFHGVMDHCSMLKTICAWRGIAPLTKRVASEHIAGVHEALREPELESAELPAAPAAPPPMAEPELEAVAREQDEVDELFGGIREKMQEEFGQDLSEFGFERR